MQREVGEQGHGKLAGLAEEALTSTGTYKVISRHAVLGGSLSGYEPWTLRMTIKALKISQKKECGVGGWGSHQRKRNVIKFLGNERREGQVLSDEALTKNTQKRGCTQ